MPPVFSPIATASLVAAALLYTPAAAPANAQALDPETRAALLEAREGEMRKLNLHAQPRPAGDTPFLDREGGEHRLADSNGSLRLVNFWATWCAPCRLEKPSLDALAAELEGEGVEVIAIATGRHDIDAIDRFNREVGVAQLATYIDETNRLAQQMGVPGLPVTVVLNREGEEIGRLMGGADWDTPNARALIRRLAALAE